MIDPMAGFTVDDLASVFRTLQADGWAAVLIGGQAVNLWADRYQQDACEWDELRPYTSRDLDYHGGLAEARLAMRVLHARGRLNTGSDPGPNAGVLQVALPDGRELLVDILTGVYGVSAAEIERTAVSWSGVGILSDLTLRVIHPLLLIEAKTASLRGLPQAGRQDAKHLRMLVLIVRQWLREQLAHPRSAFRAVERLVTCAASPDGLHAFTQGIDLIQSLPLDDMRCGVGYAAFFDRRWPQLNDQLSEKRERHLRAMQDERAL
jgi:hypothetical protein